MQHRLGWVGTGIMGRSMAANLLKGGFVLSVHNRTKEKAIPLLNAGATWCDTAGDVGRSAEIVFLMLGTPDDVRRVVFDLLETMSACGTIVDMTTSSPSLERELSDRCEAQGISYLDAPVSGGDIGARSATLSIMVGGSQERFVQMLPYFELMGKIIVHHGGVGNGQHAKMVNQTLISGTMIGLCEALLYATRAGLDMQKALASVERGAAGSWSLSNLAPRILCGDFRPGFLVEHFLKDLGIVLQEAKQMGLVLPGLELARKLYLTAASHGYSRNGTQALILALAEMSGTAFSPPMPPFTE